MKIVYVFSPNWFRYFLIACFSLFSNNPSPIKVYLISDSLQQKQLDLMQELCDKFGEGYEIEYINIKEDIFNEINIDTTYYTKYTLYRLLIPSLIDEKKVLYLDADTLVCQNITELYNFDLKKNLIAGAKEIFMTNEYKKEIGLKNRDKYVNAGVLLMNLEEFRKQSLEQKIIELANSQHFLYHDQCILNKVCQGQIEYISNSYNVSVVTWEKLNALRPEIKIIHFVGRKQPWVHGLPYCILWTEQKRKWEEFFL